jgi:polysaccharide biosynthesis/export protein
VTTRLLAAALVCLSFLAAPAARAESAANAAPPAAHAQDYMIGANDKLDIRVFELQQLDRTVRVTSDGTISLPLLGEVQVGGLTPRQAEETIARMLQDKKMVLNPQVSVQVVDFVSRRVYVQGAVPKPGTFDLLGDRTLLDVIGEAGGLLKEADRKIFVSRPFAKAGEERIVIDAEKLFYQGDPLANMQIQPGDIITIPFRQDFKVFVNGAVQRPGPVEYLSHEMMTLLQAVTAAGGASDRANESKVQIIRRLPDGTKRVFKVNLKRIKHGKDEDMLLERNDIVVVPESFF